MNKTSVEIPSKKHLRFALVIIASVVAVATRGQAQTFKVLHTFNGTNGGLPRAKKLLSTALVAGPTEVVRPPL
jgi:hypothetical protein